MATHKIFCIILALIFGFSIFASGAFARVKCDMDNCKHHQIKGLQYKKASTHFVAMGCCTGSQKEPCDLEGGQILQIYDCALSHARADNGDHSHILITGSNPRIEDLFLKDFALHSQTTVNMRSAPLYIQNASLII